MEGHDRSVSPWYSDHARASVPLYRDFEQRAEPAEAPPSFYAPRNPPTHPRPSEPQFYDLENPEVHLPHIEHMAAPPRYAGDGLDFRRPYGAAREPYMDSPQLSEEEEDDEVIDLTADDSGYGASQDGNAGVFHHEGRDVQHLHQPRRPPNPPSRLPRGMDVIIDLESGHEEWRLVSPPPAVVPHSPDIQFVSSRRIGNPDGDEVQFVRENPLPEAEVQRRRAREREREQDRGLERLIATRDGRYIHLAHHVADVQETINRTAARLYAAHAAPVAPARRAGPIRIGFAAPMLDFALVGFDMGMGAPVPAPPAPTYKAPDKAPEGFTRSPKEEGALMCPNCEEELCTGDNDTKRQVWLVKTCGHVSFVLNHA
jgi:hypothetical protein